MDKDETLRCIICGEEFSEDEMWEHISLAGSGSTDFEHHRYYNSIVASNDPKICFCGGRIHCRTFMRDTDDLGWDLSCLRCGFLYSED